MPVIEDMDIEIDALEVVLALHHGRRAPEELVEETRAAIERSRNLIRPRAVYEWIPVLGVEGEDLLLKRRERDQEFRIRIGPHADLMAKSELALVSIVTIGDQLNGWVSELNQSRQMLESYLVDSVGVVALGEVGKTVRGVAESEAESRGWGVSPSLAPGSLHGWSIEGQHDICDLVPPDRIGVHLNESGMLIPIKSAASLIGLGPTYKSKKVGSVCRFCVRAGTCWRRKN